MNEIELLKYKIELIEKSVDELTEILHNVVMYQKELNNHIKMVDEIICGRGK